MTPTGPESTKWFIWANKAIFRKFWEGRAAFPDRSPKLVGLRLQLRAGHSGTRILRTSLGCPDPEVLRKGPNLDLI